VNRNERTPRTLAECQWHTGYPTVSRRASQAANYAMAVFIGVALASVLWFNL
jgi:hypothetical protein